MKLKLILCLLGLFSLLEVSAYSVVDKNEVLKMEPIQLTGNDIPYDILTKGDKDDHRSVRPEEPILAVLDTDNYFLDLYFEAAIGEVEITLSKDGAVVYSSSENIRSSVQKSIPFALGESGSFLIEIEGKNGAYVCGRFEL